MPLQRRKKDKTKDGSNMNDACTHKFPTGIKIEELWPVANDVAVQDEKTLASAISWPTLTSDGTRTICTLIGLKRY